jgi:cobalt-zinc-cadmium efflux system membrane fusion protein
MSRVLLAVLILSCACSKPHKDEDDAHDEAPKRAAPSGNHVQLTAEAIKRAQISVAKVERRALSSGAAIAAEVQFDPTSTAHVGPLAAGRITRVAVELGQHVKRGELLGVINSGDASGVRSRLVQARARQASANATLRRQEQLAHEGIGAQRALIEAQTSVSELRAEVEGLERQLSALGSGSNDKGELSLLSPIDGVVVSVHGTLGESANVDQPVFVVTDPKRVWMRGDVPELEIPRLALGEPAVVRLHAYPDLALAGTITYIAPALEERTRTLPIRVSITEPDPRLRSGMFGSLELLGTDKDTRVLAVPVDAVTTLEGHDVVFVADSEPNTFHPTAVQLGRRASGYYEVRAGLQEGDNIAISGSFTLKSVLREADLSDGDSD